MARKPHVEPVFMLDIYAVTYDVMCNLLTVSDIYREGDVTLFVLDEVR